MLSKETVDLYRRVTPGQRLTLTLQAIREAEHYLFVGPLDVVRRRFRRIRSENDAPNRQMLTKLAEAERRRWQNSTR